MTDTLSKICDDIDTIISSSTVVASAAGINFANWSATNGHVFKGAGGFVGPRSRGRLPFIEIIPEMSTYTPQMRSSQIDGTVTSQIKIRCHAQNRQRYEVEILIQDVLLASIVEIRDSTSNNYFEDGSEVMSPLLRGPWGYYKDLDLTVEHTFTRSTYERH